MTRDLIDTPSLPIDDHNDDRRVNIDGEREKSASHCLAIRRKTLCWAIGRREL